MRQRQRVQRTYCKQCTRPSMNITLIETGQHKYKDNVLKQQRRDNILKKRKENENDYVSVSDCCSITHVKTPRLSQ